MVQQAVQAYVHMWCAGSTGVRTHVVCRQYRRAYTCGVQAVQAVQVYVHMWCAGSESRGATGAQEAVQRYTDSGAAALHND